LQHSASEVREVPFHIKEQIVNERSGEQVGQDVNPYLDKKQWNYERGVDVCFDGGTYRKKLLGVCRTSCKEERRGTRAKRSLFFFKGGGRELFGEIERKKKKAATSQRVVSALGGEGGFSEFSRGEKKKK